MAIEETERILQKLGYSIKRIDGVSIFLEEKKAAEEQIEPVEKNVPDPVFEEMVVNADYIIMFLPENGKKSVSSPLPSEILSDLSVTSKAYLNTLPGDCPLLVLHQLPNEGENAIALQYGPKRIYFLFNKIQNTVVGQMQTNDGTRWLTDGETLPEVYLSDLEVILKAGRIVAEGIRVQNQESIDGSGTP